MANLFSIHAYSSKLNSSDSKTSAVQTETWMNKNIGPKVSSISKHKQMIKDFTKVTHSADSLQKMSVTTSSIDSSF